ncbi:MAG: thiamine ABC transporter ATP-binding protein [Alphaproteobacteria bacterium]
MLEVKSVRAHLGAAKMAFDLCLEAGEWCAIIGPSGAGKSTLLNLIGGFLPADTGDISWRGQSIQSLAPAQRPVTSLFQDHNLFAHLTVAQNVGLGLDPGLKLSSQMTRQVQQGLASVGLAGRAHDLPAQLSGGERQRVGLARALVRQRPVLLLDEPLSQLDPGLRRAMASLISDLVRPRGITTAMVLHTPADAAGLVDSFALVQQGAIVAKFPATDFGTSRAPAALAEFLG